MVVFCFKHCSYEFLPGKKRFKNTRTKTVKTVKSYVLKIIIIIMLFYRKTSAHIKPSVRGSHLIIVKYILDILNLYQRQ